MSEQENPTNPEDLEKQLKRALADYQNQKKRFEKEKTEVVKFANESLLLNLVGVVEGLEMTLKQFRAILQQTGFERIKVDKGDKFNGEMMEAVDGEGETVTEVLANGYKLHDKIVQPAKVKVKSEARNPKSETNTNDKNTNA